LGSAGLGFQKVNLRSSPADQASRFKVANALLSGDRYGKIRKISAQAVRYPDHHIRRRLGNFHGDP
jgi:hypothetical protein